MRFYAYKLLLLFIILLTSLTQTAAALEAPPLKGRINDYAGMLSPTAARSLEQKLAAFERETTNQVVLLTIPSLEGDVIESFAIRVADAWKIGQKDKSNGVILILAKKERKIRIEVGTGLQGVLPDITAGQIIRNVIAPGLRSGNPDQAVSAGLGAIIDATKGEFKATPTDKKATRKKKSSGYGLFIVLLLAGIVITAVAGSSSRTAGVLAGGVSLPVAAGIGLGAVLWKLGILALLGGAAGLLISLLMRLFNAGGGGGGYGGGWGGPTIFYGGGGGGSSSSDDSFSGGGGDFDGGGSSDDW
ncbi:MAG: TPM domain-containing protein [Trichlorobacter sp.]|uniref:TPM domain-containing protein n=1 Tax=Trichlorobacter sp. TaxID=2911007 RepID=UPI00256300DA|nr:TPM domain-containing protein [Trichlorobacter sp.]MDK9717802.1 TPM domain-containing protein [Trichlorobacter sp.]